MDYHISAQSVRLQNTAHTTAQDNKNGQLFTTFQEHFPLTYSYQRKRKPLKSAKPVRGVIKGTL